MWISIISCKKLIPSLIKAFPYNSSTFKFDDHNALYAYSWPTFDAGAQYESGKKPAIGNEQCHHSRNHEKRAIFKTVLKSMQCEANPNMVKAVACMAGFESMKPQY